MWKTHYDKINQEKHPAALTLRKTLNLINNDGINTGTAIDLGCGNGVDTLAMLEQGFEVLAIDQDPNAALHLQSINTPYIERLCFQKSSFECLNELPLTNLVNATFSLPFCHPNQFEKLWHNITHCINSEGYFCGHFFGPRDSWSSNANMTFHHLESVKNLFEGFELVYFEETEKQGKTLSGKAKLWHVFHVVAKKK